jgi:hypothetical protein
MRRLFSLCAITLFAVSACTSSGVRSLPNVASTATSDLQTLPSHARRIVSENYATPADTGFHLALTSDRVRDFYFKSDATIAIGTRDVAVKRYGEFLSFKRGGVSILERRRAASEPWHRILNAATSTRKTMQVNQPSCDADTNSCTVDGCTPGGNCNASVSDCGPCADCSGPIAGPGGAIDCYETGCSDSGGFGTAIFRYDTGWSCLLSFGDGSVDCYGGNDNYASNEFPVDPAANLLESYWEGNFYNCVISWTPTHIGATGPFNAFILYNPNVANFNVAAKWDHNLTTADVQYNGYPANEAGTHDVTFYYASSLVIAGYTFANSPTPTTDSELCM